MPELPEVETFRSYFKQFALNRVVVAISIQDERIIAGTGTEKIWKYCMNRQFVEAERYGKYLLAETEEGACLVFHFGMTGYLVSAIHQAHLPVHTRFVIHFHDNTLLGFVNQRLFGRVTICASPSEFIQVKKLGPDAMAVSIDEFATVLKSSSGAIKTVLMDQHRIAGIGNLYSDEALFQTGIHPSARADTLDSSKVAFLYDTVRRILGESIACNADFSALPADYLVNNRNRNAVCPRCGTRLCTDKIGGRTAYFCAKCQS
jgi:formamidopyrimidine-DNA glycosylase